ncbi:MAG TPA: thioredoxin domain-containing protein [Chitinophagales bacterium]|nr:thioredoxin domain-containing protein [Chitinophagales bacterium]
MSTLKLPVNAADHYQGSIDAAITIVEYGDFQCPYCRRAHPLVKRLLKERGNELLFVFRNFPLSKIHRYARISATTAEASGKQGKFWEMHDLIFENQNKITPDYLLALAEDIELDLLQLEQDSKSEDVRNKIMADFESGIRSGVNRTPTFFINGSHLLTYDETYESLLDAVQLEVEMKER